MKITGTGQFPLATMMENNQTPPQGQDGFGEALVKACHETKRLQQDADSRVQAHVTQGEGDIHEVMLAMEKAGLALKMLVQCRNKLITAYEELNRIQV